jgi:hypothetical protein
MGTEICIVRSFRRPSVRIAAAERNPAADDRPGGHGGEV